MDAEEAPSDAVEGEEEQNAAKEENVTEPQTEEAAGEEIKAEEEGPGEGEAAEQVEVPPAAEAENENAEAPAESDDKTSVEPFTETSVEPSTETAVDPPAETEAAIDSSEPVADPATETEVEPSEEPQTETTGAEPETDTEVPPVTEAEAEPSGGEAEVEPKTETGDISDTVTEDVAGVAQDEEGKDAGGEERDGGEVAADSAEKDEAEAVAVEEEPVTVEMESENANEVSDAVDEMGPSELPSGAETPDKPEMEDEQRVAAFHMEKEARVSTGSQKPPVKPKQPNKEPEKKYKKTYPYLARAKEQRESHVMRHIRKQAPTHDYFGLIFSAETTRPPSYYHNYFLPIQKQPKKQQHMKIVGKTIPPEAVNGFLRAPLHSMPLSAIKVRWVLHRRSTVYKASDLYAYLEKYGKIERVYQVTNNSAIVVFETMLSAISAINDPSLGYPWDRLLADWLEPRLNNRGYYAKHAYIEEYPYTSERLNHDDEMKKLQQHCTPHTRKKKR